ncbi:MAG: hypothetical protein FWE85_02580 [Clostridiales bacterium]|nr:hypothetical protein [Clostridiales bacterium]
MDISAALALSAVLAAGLLICIVILFIKAKAGNKTYLIYLGVYALLSAALYITMGTTLTANYNSLFLFLDNVFLLIIYGYLLTPGILISALVCLPIVFIIPEKKNKKPILFVLLANLLAGVLFLYWIFFRAFE